MTDIDRRTLVILAGLSFVAVAGLIALEPSSLLAVAALPAVLALVFIAWGALHSNRTAVLLLLFTAVFLLDAVFRVREYENKDVDFQVVLKLGVWFSIAAVALFHIRDWLATLLTPTNIPLIMFMIWLFITVSASPVPAYSAVTAFSLVAYILFAAYLFANFEPADVFATIVIALTAFCLVSIFLYFAVPSFGRYVYWVNGERYTSLRLAGLAGSANNMGRIAAFALVIIGLYARDFHRMSRYFVPVTALITGAALIMSNSRTSMMMAAAILFAVYFLNWRRLYIALFVLSAGLVAAAIALPAGDDLLRLVSRSGSLDEMTSMTGRTEIWYAVAKLAEAKPIMGYGYGSSVFVLPEHERAIGFLTSHAHNLALQLLLTTGWVGLVLFSLSVLAVGLRASVTGNRAALALLSFVLLNGITESSGFTTLANICSLAFAIAVVVPPTESRYEMRPAYQRRFS